MSKIYHREIHGGPSREQLFDSLRYGFKVRFDMIINNPSKEAVILDIHRVHYTCNDSWKIKFKMGERTFDCFYSTNTRSGFICNTDLQIILPPLTSMRYLKVDHYPVTDYELMVLLNLPMVFYRPLYEVVLRRLKFAIPGIMSPSTDVYNQAQMKARALKNLFYATWQKPRYEETYTDFRELLQ